jgi:hypothetical protein
MVREMAPKKVKGKNKSRSKSRSAVKSALEPGLESRVPLAAALLNSITEPEPAHMEMSTQDIPTLVAANISSLLDQWENVYQDRLAKNIVLLRNDKLLHYAKQTMEAKRDVDLSQARVNVWRQVFEERYGLSGDPAVASETFLSHGIEKLAPDDIDNINRYMRFRSIFLILYNDALARKDPIINHDIVQSLVTVPVSVKRRGGTVFPLYRPRLMMMRVGGAKKKLKTDEKLGAELQKYKTLAKVRPPRCDTDEKDPKKQLNCVWRENIVLQNDYNEELKLRMEAEEELEELKDRRSTVGEVQPWMTADWSNLEVLPAPEVSVEHLRQSLSTAKNEMVGRDEIMNRLASMVHTFAYNYRAFLKTYLNYALLGLPGTGKTTIAQSIANILRSLGILVTRKFSIVGREDFVGQYLGETALKTKALLTNHVEGVLFLDEAYSLGTRDSSGKPDVYGAEALNTITNFTDKWRGQIAFLAAGYEEDMNRDFFGVNRGLERRFLRLTLPSFSAKQLVTIYIQKLLDKIYTDADRRAIANPELWQYVYSAFITLNKKCLGTSRNLECLFPNQGGDIETLADSTVQYFYNFVKPKINRQNTELTVCDMQEILRRFFFQTQRVDILLTSKLTNCNPPTTCHNGMCQRLSNPNLELINQFHNKDKSKKKLSRPKTRSGGFAPPPPPVPALLRFFPSYHKFLPPRQFRF